MFPVFILIIGIVLVIYSYLLMRKNNEIDGNKESFDLMLRNNKEQMSDYKMEIGLLRKDVGESLTELQQDIIQIRQELNKIKGNSNFNENIYMDENVSPEETSMAEKAKAIKELLDLNIADDDICKKLSVSKGEVLLVKGLYK